jgi:hypothetical protein
VLMWDGGLLRKMPALMLGQVLILEVRLCRQRSGCYDEMVVRLVTTYRFGKLSPGHCRHVQVGNPGLHEVIGSAVGPNP